MLSQQAYKKNPSLGKWVSKQRDAYRDLQRGKPSNLSQEKIEKLENLGFRFKIGKGKAVRQWDSYFADLVSFKEKFGRWIFEPSISFFMKIRQISLNP